MEKKYLIIALILLVLVPSAICITTLVVNETENVKFTVAAVDKDKDPLTYTFSPPINSSGEWQTTLNDSGEYLINVTASDGAKNTTQQVLLVVNDVNEAPSMIIDDVEANEGQLVTLEPEVTDANNDKIKLKFSKPFDKKGEWQTTYADAGEYNITVTASDGELETSKTIIVTISDINVAPVVSILPSDKVEVLETESVEFEANASDFDNDELTYKWYLDDELVSEEETFTFNTDFDSSGVYDLILEVSDKETSVQAYAVVSVINLNREPVIDLYDSITINEGDLLDLELPARDIDGDAVSYTISESVGDDQVWQTGFEDAGVYDIKIKADDGDIKTEKTLKLTVLDVDRAPKTDDVSAEVKENEEMKLKLNFTDPDGDKVTYNIIDAPEGVNLEKNTLTWTPDNDVVVIQNSWIAKQLFKWGLIELGKNQSKVYTIKMQAAGKNKTSEFNVYAAVWNVNRAPVVNISDVNVDETQKIHLEPYAFDPDGDPLIISYGGAMQNENYRTTYDDDGIYNSVVFATDGDLWNQKNFTITIYDVNRLPELVTQKAVFKENEAVSVALEAADPDKDNVTITAISLPEGIKFKKTNLTFTPDFDYVSHNNSKLNVVQTALFALSDGIDIVNKTLQIVVKDTDRAPVIEPIDDITVNENGTLNIPVNATDPDGDYVLVTFSGLVNKNNKKLGFETEGEHNVTVTASDGKLKSSVVVPVNVEKTNRAPRIVTNTVTFKENKTSSVQLKAFDADGDTVKIKAISLPKGAVLSNNTLTFTPGYEFVSHNVSGWEKVYTNIVGYRASVLAELTVTDGEKTTLKNITIIVKDADRAPVVTAKIITAKENEKLNISVEAFDADGDNVQTSLLGFGKYNNKVLGFDTEGNHSASVVANDGMLKSKSTFTITVQNTNRAPSLQLKPVTIYENQAAQLVLAGLDPDNDKLSYNIAKGPYGAYIVNSTLYWNTNFSTIAHTEIVKSGSKNVTKNIDLSKAGQLSYTVPVSIEVTDGKLSAIANTTIKVIDVNRAPEIYNSTPYEEFTVMAGTVINFSVSAVDLDGDNLTYTWIPGDGKSYVDGSNHLRLVKSAGLKTMEVKVSDGKASKSYTWTYLVKALPVPKPVVKEQQKPQQTQVQTVPQPQQPVQRINVPAVQSSVVEG